MTAGNLIVCGVSTGNNGAVALADSINTSYSHLTQLIFDTNFSVDIFYFLASASGADNVTITSAAGDMSLRCAEYHDSAGGAWTFDNSISVNGASIGATASPRTGNFTTTGSNDVWYMYFADETATWSGACATFPCPTGSFTNIQWDNGHIDAEAEWLGATAQTNLSSGWTASSSASTHWAIYLAAFTAGTPAPVVIPKNQIKTQGAKLSVQGGKVTIK